MIGVATTRTTMSKYLRADIVGFGSEAAEALSDNADPYEEADQKSRHGERDHRSHRDSDPRAHPSTQQIDREQQRPGASGVAASESGTAVRHAVDTRWGPGTRSDGR